MNNNFWLFGAKLEILLDEQTIGSTYDIIKGTFSSGMGVPLHVHSNYTETIYVLQGEQTVLLDKEKKVLTAGQSVFIPAGTPHLLVSSGTGDSVSLSIAVPGGFAKLIRKAGIPVTKGSDIQPEPNDMGVFAALSEALGDQLLGPPGGTIE